MLNELQAIRFAMRHGKPIFRWILPMLVGKNQYEDFPPERSTVFLNAGARELQFFFVRGMPIIITVKIGHDTWKIANGRTAVAHSFSHDDSSQFVMPAEALGPAAAGRIFTIPQPEHINVRLLPLKSDLADSPAIIIPVAAVADKHPMERFLKHAPKSTTDTVGKSAPSVRHHPLEVGFSITYNKLQGATMDRLILVLNDLGPTKLGNMTVQKLYVALSRVRMGCHKAIFPATSSQLEHLTKKTNPSALQAWHRHYDKEGKWRAVPIILPR